VNLALEGFCCPDRELGELLNTRTLKRINERPRKAKLFPLAGAGAPWGGRRRTGRARGGAETQPVQDRP
jgi:hypothetical protein